MIHAGLTFRTAATRPPATIAPISSGPPPTIPVVISVLEKQRSALCSGHHSHAIIEVTAIQVSSAISSARDIECSVVVTTVAARTYDSTAKSIARSPGIAMNIQLDIPASIAKLRITGSMIASASQQQIP